MELDFEKGCVSVENININISELIKVGLIDFVFNNVKLTFVYSEDRDYHFMYSDTVLYAELLKAIAGSPKEVGRNLCQYQNDFGVEHELWSQLLKCTFEKFNIDRWSYAEECGIDYCNDYFHHNTLHGFYPQKVNNIQEVYNLLNSVLPQNFSETKRRYLKEKAESGLKVFTDICGSNLDNKEAYLAYLETINKNDVDKWNVSKEKLQSFKVKAQEFAQEGLFDSRENNDIQWFLEYCISYVCGRVSTLVESILLQQYGPVGDLKKSLRESIDRLGFMELVDLFKEYKEKERLICSKARYVGINLNESPHKQYVDVYRLGSVLISDRMNQINKNKAKNKYIPQDLIDEALIFYYDADSVKDAYSARSNEKYSQDKKNGYRGEQKVEYAIKWLDKSYVRIERKSNDRIGDSCIYILNPDFIDERQEYDHLIVSNKGLFNIETKNYSGKLIIDQYGNWIRKKNEKEEGIKNPLQQIRQHEKVLKSFLPNECKVISIICIANDKSIIEGSENCPIPIVKSDMLVEFIENWDKTKMKMSDSEVEQCVQAIYKHMV